MDNQAIAHVLAEIADLLEIKGENAFRVRAYRTAAETVASSAAALAMLPAVDLQKLPGIGKDLAGEREEDIYEALGLQCIPPELRENRGEIERAASHALPRLIELADLRGDIHAHTDATDGRDDLDRMARGAAAAGLSWT